MDPFVDCPEDEITLQDCQYLVDVLMPIAYPKPSKAVSYNMKRMDYEFRQKHQELFNHYREMYLKCFGDDSQFGIRTIHDRNNKPIHSVYIKQ